MGVYVGRSGRSAVLPGQTNPNFLDNWYFVNPINRRGASTYSSAGPIIDRWKLSANVGFSLTAELTPEGITLSNSGENLAYFLQTFSLAEFSEFEGKRVTMSALFGDTLYSATDIIPVSANTGSSAMLLVTPIGRIRLYRYADSIAFTVDVDPGMSGTLKAVKMELGDRQTLARQKWDGSWELNEIPNYAAEYAKCAGYDPITGLFVGGGITVSTTDLTAGTSPLTSGEVYLVYE